ncbi:Transglycosylase SLT domain [Corynebacterium uterequi]|uniref:Transglycosylase SLT domain n=1 Tax=Corynebacterium uterequi TaxID=1072256 RepID=A0A0G3HI00_9CORY|nr:lytic murein transglycosylase [Corynebacterium uterequi]AKK10757.1 Transglycosylase SLT domain [Corynebacterium uterequi]
MINGNSTYGGARRSPGCGCGIVLAVVLVVVLIVTIVGWALSLGTAGSPTSRVRIPDDVPPAAGEPVPAIDVHSPGRTSDKLGFWADPISQSTGIPAPAVRAYGNATLIANEAWPGCNLTWNTLAGIGWVETRHGTYTGSLFGRGAIGEDGVVTPPIIGIALDGTNGTAEIRDTDGGKFDGDTHYDRAVGPMQFIPDSWYRYGLDASGDGYADPHHIDDAALGAAKHLCDQGRDLSTPEGWTRAIHSYNKSNEYLIDVRNAAANYAVGQSA